MVTKLQIEITPMWSVIAEVKERIATAMEGKKKSNIDFASMVASELLENAIKYGVSNKNIPQVSLDFELSDNKVVIKVKNGIIESENIEVFKRTMKKINDSTDRKNLYLERLQEIMDDPSQRQSHLGLYRIVSEGEYELNFELKDNVLEMIATKQI